MCLWHEGISAWDGGPTRRSGIDNCTSQNKNRMIIMTMIYLVAKYYSDVIETRYLVSGHTVVKRRDRNFDLITLRKKAGQRTIVLDEVDDLVRTARSSNPIFIIQMDDNAFSNFGSIADEFISINNHNNSKLSHIRVTNQNAWIL